MSDVNLDLTNSLNKFFALNNLQSNPAFPATFNFNIGDCLTGGLCKIFPDFRNFLSNNNFINDSCWSNIGMHSGMFIGDTFTFSGGVPSTAFNVNPYSKFGNTSHEIKVDKITSKKTEKSSGKKAENLSVYNPVSHNEYISSPYAKASKAEAEAMAKKSPHLERINNAGKHWHLGGTFKNDIPYAMKGINELMDYVGKHVESRIGESLVVTSALGTKTSPHTKRGNNTHYNPTNPKIDLGNAWSKSRCEKVAKELISTGLFDFVNVEKNRGSSTYHIDMRFKDNAYGLMKRKAA